MRELEQKLNYHFRNGTLLEQALRHSSFVNEHRNWMRNNERLEFLGDSVLGFVAAEYLYRQYPDLPEGRLTQSRAKLVCEESLSGAAARLGLGEYLRLGRGEKENGGREKASILADAMEAVIAAVYLDGGILAARELIRRIVLDNFPEADILGEQFSDYKSALQELVQRKPDRALVYRVSDEQGPDHAKVFTVEALVNGQPYGQGSGRSKKEAEQAAARAALAKLREEEPE